MSRLFILLVLFCTVVVSNPAATISFYGDVADSFFLCTAGAEEVPKCTPTTPDMLGPFYEPDAPVRASVGHGYTLSGSALSSEDCSPIKGAKIEFWLAGPNGSYDDGHRATMFSDESGGYRFGSNYPPSYFRRPPHIHIKVSADGFETLVTQHYPVKGATQGKMDLVLSPSK